MADQTQFKHIKVNAACDDVVIYAGSHEPMKAAEESASGASAAVSDQGRQSDHPAQMPDDFHSTTIKDLAASKMPTMQKAIIAIAVAAVAAFIIWYLLFQ